MTVRVFAAAHQNCGMVSTKEEPMFTVIKKLI